MANALGSLFQDIADAIRDKTGETGTMKPVDFPSAIAAIIAGGGGGNAVFAFGEHNVSATGKQTINHGLGVVPDVVFVAIKSHRQSTVISAVGMHSDLIAKYGVSYSQITDYNVTGNYAMLSKNTSYAIDKVSEVQNGICDATGDTFSIMGFEGYTDFVVGSTYRWIAISGLSSSGSSGGGGGGSNDLIMTALATGFAQGGSSTTASALIDIPKDSEVISYGGDSAKATSSSANPVAKTSSNLKRDLVTVTEGDYKRFHISFTCTGNTYTSAAVTLSVTYRLPGMYMEDGVVYAPPALDIIPNACMFNAHPVKKLALANATFTKAPNYAFAYMAELEEVELPAMASVPPFMFMNCEKLVSVKFDNVTSLAATQVFCNNEKLKTVDLTRCTQVPAVQSVTFYNFPSDLQILVPAALYDEWIATSKWDTYADNIVPV